jgi:3-oxosteroid 1-dehydrogenase
MAALMTDTVRTSDDIASSYDVVVAGTGIAGLSAALAAAEAGLSVVLFDKDGLIGGGTALSYGGLWAGCNHLAKAAGIADDRQSVYDYMQFVAGGSAKLG